MMLTGPGRSIMEHLLPCCKKDQCKRPKQRLFVLKITRFVILMGAVLFLPALGVPTAVGSRPHLQTLRQKDSTSIYCDMKANMRVKKTMT